MQTHLFKQLSTQTCIRKKYINPNTLTRCHTQNVYNCKKYLISQKKNNLIQIPEVQFNTNTIFNKRMWQRHNNVAN